MKKQKADEIITEYLPKLYGFAMKKSFSYDEAEKLCSEIVLQVYQSLLKAEEIANIEGYIWRISEHTYAKYVSTEKKKEGVSIDGMNIAYYESFYSVDEDFEVKRLRREIAFLSQTRRKIVYLFYYKNRSVSSIAAGFGIPEGTVKWHLNKARAELKEGLSMERKIGTLGLYPVEAINFVHHGMTGNNGGPEFYLSDKINLNIVYSVYYSPKTKEEIAQELGLTLVFIEDKINLLEDNGFIVKTKHGKYTTYVRFTPPKYSLELQENETKAQLKIAEELVKAYVPLVRAAVADIKDVYIPTQNRELFEAAAIFYGISGKLLISTERDLSKYTIKTTDGGSYIAYVMMNSECSDPEYEPTLKDLPSYWGCGNMFRRSDKYPAMKSWSFDTRLSSRKGGWQNNLASDYVYLYEFIRGDIADTPASSDKMSRLRARNFISDDMKPNIMIVKGDLDEIFDKILPLSQPLKDKIAATALEFAALNAKDYPPQMQDLIIESAVNEFVGPRVALMVMDILYSNGTFKPLNEREKITSNLIMFSDILPTA